MNTTRKFRLKHTLGSIAAAALLIGCAEGRVTGPDEAGMHMSAAGGGRADLGVCNNLQVAAGYPLALHVYARGVQIYRWSETGWTFIAPEALLSADAAGHSTIGTHYAGPTWESMSGGKVVGTVLERCTPDDSAIAWLLLAAVPTDGPGIFHRVAFIQRVNTAGGKAPVDPGSFIGEEVRVPYTTEYLFYRQQ